MNPIWIGLFDLTAPPDNAFLEGNAGACVWAAAQAEDAAKLRLRVENAVGELGLTLVDSEQMREVINEDELTEQLAALIPPARKDVNAIVFGTWHKFKHYDA